MIPFDIASDSSPEMRTTVTVTVTVTTMTGMRMRMRMLMRSVIKEGLA